jgi:hypothetical protein
MSLPSPRTAAPPWIPLGIRESLKDGRLLLLLWGLLLWGAFTLRLLLFAFGFLVWEAFGREKNC